MPAAELWLNACTSSSRALERFQPSLLWPYKRRPTPVRLPLRRRLTSQPRGEGGADLFVEDSGLGAAGDRRERAGAAVVSEVVAGDGCAVGPADQDGVSSAK